MAWIETVAPDHAEGELAELYRAIGSARGGVADVHRVQSLNPRALKAHLEIYKAVVFARSPLGRKARERIAVVVSASNRCAYCVAHHSEALRQLGESSEVVDSLGRGEIPVSLPEADRALLRWAATTATEPSRSDEADIAELRRLDYDDRAILDAALTIAYFSFVNRLVLLLGVEVEDDYQTTCGDAATTARS
jgi:uncharacterized peroxidase-related enzyme